MALVKDIFRISKGKKVSNVFDKPNSAYVRYIQIEDLRHNNNLKYTNESELVSAKESDVIIAWDGAYAGTIGFGISGIIGSTLARLTIKDEFKERCSGKYLGYYLSGKFSYFQNTATGATIPHVSKNALESLDIPIPDIETQNKIVAILDKASALVQKRQQTIDLLDELLRAQFQYLFGDILLNPKGWPTSTIDNICDVQSGLTLSQTKRESYPLEVPYLRVANVFRGRVDLTEIKKIRATGSEVARTKLERDDILIVEGHGNINEIGRAASWNFDDLDMVHQNHLIRLRINTSKILPTYLEHLLNSQGGIYKMRDISSSTSGLNTISTGKVKEIEIPIPEIETQKSFDLLVRLAHVQSIKTKRSLTYISTLFDAILQRAFSGKLDLNVSIELDALLEEIDLQKPENDLFSITTNEAYLLSLVNRLNNQEFESQDLYDKAKHAAFQLLKEEELLAQAYDEQTQRLKLVLQ